MCQVLRQRGQRRPLPRERGDALRGGWMCGEIVYHVAPPPVRKLAIDECVQFVLAYLGAVHRPPPLSVERARGMRSRGRAPSALRSKFKCGDRPPVPARAHRHQHLVERGYTCARRLNSWSKPPTAPSIGRETLAGGVATDETDRLIASNKVEGTAVYQGERLGAVYNFMVDKRSGRVEYAVISFGGFLGIGDSYHPLPWKTLKYDTSMSGYVVDLDKDRLQGAPRFMSSEIPDWRDPSYSRRIDDLYPHAEAGDPIVTRHELAIEARDQAATGAEPADEGLQQAVDQSVPTAERLPRGADENPLSERARAGAAAGQHNIQGWRQGAEVGTKRSEP
jgi:hypothetical protein